MNRYDHGFRSLPAHIQADAAQRVDAARSAIIQHRFNGFGPEDDESIVRQFGLSGMKEFWEIELSEPMTCASFVYVLALHSIVIEATPDMSDEELKRCGPAALARSDGFKLGLRIALRQARTLGEPWFSEISEPPQSTKLDAKAMFGFVPSDVVFVPPDPPLDGIDLSRLRVQARDAVEWLLAMPKRRHLVPPSLAAALKNEIGKAGQGRPTGTGYEAADRPLLRAMLDLMREGKCCSPTDAAWQVVGRNGSGAKGNGQPEAKVTRLVKRFAALKNGG